MAEINSTNINDLPSTSNLGTQQPVQQNVNLSINEISNQQNTIQQQGQLNYNDIVNSMSNKQVLPTNQIPNPQNTIQEESKLNYNDIVNTMANNKQVPSNQIVQNAPPADNGDLSNILKSMEQIASSSDVLGLPSRDIPQMSNREDIQTTPNYVPQHKNYIEEYQGIEDIKEKKRKEDNRTTSLHYLYEELQIPIIIGLLYFLFHLPIINNWFTRNFKFAFHGDGNMNLNGYILKSVVFAFLYFALLSFMKNMNIV